MRKAVRIVFLFVVGLLSSVFVGVMVALTSAVSLAATALIVPGTGTPNANVIPNYMENAVDYYLQGTFCTTEGGCDDVGEDLIGINYPASFWPLPFPGWCRSGPGGCEKWNTSVADGVAGLNAELIEQWTANPEENIVIFGYSQGGGVVSNEMRNLANLSPELKEQLQIVMIGNIENPNGGLWPRLNFLNFFGELLLDATLGPPMITDIGIPTTNIGFEYDPVVYSPKFWGNPLALLNALAAFDNVHGQYLAGPDRPGSGTLPYGYTEEELAAALADPNNIRYGGNDPTSDNKYIMIPAKSLPLANLIQSVADSAGIGPIVKPLVSLFAPMAKVIIDLGYDWSGDPNTPQGLSILPFNPFQNWVEVGLKLAVAAVEGIQAFVADLGGLTGAVAPADPEPVSTLALASSAETETPDATAKAAVETPKLALVKDDSEATVQELDAVVEDETTTDETTTDETTAGVEETTTEAEEQTTPSTEEEPATKPEDETESDPSDATTAGSTADEDATKDEDTKDDAKKDEAKKDEAKKDEAKKDEATKDEATKDDSKDADNEKAAA